MTNPMVIAIDGPAGAGKSTTAKAIARRLGMLYLDTGAMYRAATHAAMSADVDLDDADAVAAYVTRRHIAFDDTGQVTVDGSAPGPVIRTPAVTDAVYHVADDQRCRKHLVGLQQQLVGERHAVVEGRDATTVICPSADLKIYLDASAEERARRRHSEWQSAGASAPTVDEITRTIRKRDLRDQQRQYGALTKSDDAIEVTTDGRTAEQVVAHIIALAVRRRPMLLETLVTDQVLVGRSRQPGYVRVAQGSVQDPPAPWQLGLTNPSSGRLPGRVERLALNEGGRQAGVLLQGSAAILLAGRGDAPGQLDCLPMLPQTWYVIEPGCWHAVIQAPGTIAAWAEASGLREHQAALTAEQRAVLSTYESVYFNDEA